MSVYTRKVKRPLKLEHEHPKLMPLVREVLKVRPEATTFEVESMLPTLPHTSRTWLRRMICEYRGKLKRGKR